MNVTKAEYLPIDKLHPFEDHPFQVKDDDQMEQLVWSILSQGLMTPIIVRPTGEGEYEVVSGHRRIHACKKAGIDTIPAFRLSRKLSNAGLSRQSERCSPERLRRILFHRLSLGTSS